jgi:hypothetical protein
LRSIRGGNERIEDYQSGGMSGLRTFRARKWVGGGLPERENERIEDDQSETITELEMVRASTERMED